MDSEDKVKQPAMVRAKFICQEVTKTKSGNTKFLYSYKFSAVYGQGDNGENAKYWEYTPSGSISLTSIKQDLFDVGREYYLDFTLAEISNKEK